MRVEIMELKNYRPSWLVDGQTSASCSGPFGVNLAISMPYNRKIGFKLEECFIINRRSRRHRGDFALCGVT